MQVPAQELLGSELFSWISEEGVEMFSNCFDLEVERIPAGESRESRGRIGYLLSGKATAAGRDLAADDAAGVTLEEDGTFRRQEFTLRAVEPCAVAWMNGEILTSVCYRACWFHGRLLQEMTRLLSVRREQA